MPNVTIGTHTLTELNDKDNYRQWGLNGHLASKPKVVIQKRRIGDGSEGSNVGLDIKVVAGTEDAAGLPLQRKIAFALSVDYPVGYTQADLDDALLTFREIVASTEFGNAVSTSFYLG